MLLATGALFAAQQPEIATQAATTSPRWRIPGTKFQPLMRYDVHAHHVTKSRCDCRKRAN